MNLKRFLCALLCALIAVSGMAMAEDPKDQRIAELEQQVAELTAQVEEYHRKELVAEFDGGEVMAADAQAQYAAYEQMYQQYGISLKDYGMEDTVKQQVATDMVEEKIVLFMADKLGIALSDEARAQFETEASEAYESTVKMYYEQYFKESYPVEAEGLAASAEYLNGMGYGYDELLDSHIKSYLRDEVYNHVTSGVAVTEEDVKASYDELVKGDEENYKDNPSAYENARSNGTLIAWNPEGYRAVKHILFKFDEDQSARYADLIGKKDALNTEKTAEPEEGVEKREDAVIDGEIAAIDQQLDALYQELMPEVEAAEARFNDGEDINALIAELNEDTGMTEDGYAVAANSALWDPAFTAGAMAIPEIGGISEPVRGIYGVHLIYYMADIPAGAVPLEQIHDKVETTALEDKLADTYSAQLDAWKQELNLKMYLENF
ncbi:MAG: hypothetical protein GX647_05890 [Clostridiales bacterium]|jgi:hypothetical protein|nr:hypothetical protein [Clostridiales bacterium]OPZ67048.1 MAG: peptidylprolyl isomerase [Firmicutes bacterium ADurb.Bin467]